MGVIILVYTGIIYCKIYNLQKVITSINLLSSGMLPRETITILIDVEVEII